MNLIMSLRPPTHLRCHVVSMYFSGTFYLQTSTCSLELPCTRSRPGCYLRAPARPVRHLRSNLAAMIGPCIRRGPKVGHAEFDQDSDWLEPGVYSSAERVSHIARALPFPLNLSSSFTSTISIRFLNVATTESNNTLASHSDCLRWPWFRQR